MKNVVVRNIPRATHSDEFQQLGVATVHEAQATTG